MKRSVCLFAVILVVGVNASLWSQDKTPAVRKAPDGLYAVLREALKEKDLLPLKDGEMLLVRRDPNPKKDEAEPPRFLVVRKAPNVTLELAEAPKSVKEDKTIVRIFLKLEPKGATALEKLTREHEGKPIAI